MLLLQQALILGDAYQNVCVEGLVGPVPSLWKPLWCFF